METETDATLRISSIKLDVEGITSLLGTKPTNSFRKGSLMSERNPLSKRREENLWQLVSSLPRHESIEKQIESLVSFMESRPTEFLSLGESCRCDIFCGYFKEGSQGSISLSTGLLKRVARFPVDLVFDLYVSSNDSAA